VGHEHRNFDSRSASSQSHSLPILTICVALPRWSVADLPSSPSSSRRPTRSDTKPFGLVPYSRTRPIQLSLPVQRELPCPAVRTPASLSLPRRRADGWMGVERRVVSGRSLRERGFELPAGEGVEGGMGEAQGAVGGQPHEPRRARPRRALSNSCVAWCRGYNKNFTFEQGAKQIVGDEQRGCFFQVAERVLLPRVELSPVSKIGASTSPRQNVQLLRLKKVDFVVGGGIPRKPALNNPKPTANQPNFAL